MDTLLGIGLILMGGIAAASFYTPFKKVQSWSWESFWLVHAFMAYIFAPWFFALITVPWGEIPGIISSTPDRVKWLIILFGAIWGIGGFTFGLGIRYLGIGLGMSTTLGFTAAFGTLIPPLVAGNNLFSTSSGILTVIGVIVCLTGISVVGYAGYLKEQQLSRAERNKAVAEFALRKGILIAVFAGVMSASMNYGFEAGKPMAEVARQHGTHPLYANSIVLIYILMGGFVTTFIYCLYLNIKNGTIKDYRNVERRVFLRNVFFCFAAGFLWFLEFQFYGMGLGQLPAGVSVFGWSILMAGEISASNIWGFFLKEWEGVGTRTLRVLFTGILILIFSTFIILF
jgi:L-rhamnose-H+ transport protein